METILILIFFCYHKTGGGHDGKYETMETITSEQPVAQRDG